MADNKFIFTTEGRRLLVSQLGGIRFAVLGAILVRGLTMYDIDSDNDITEFEEAYKNLTLDDLTLENGIVLGMKNVSYKAQPGGNVVPESNEEYLAAFSDIVHNTLPMQYIPSIEMSDKQGNVYGTYEFDFDKTSLSWDMANNISFQHIILLGKQYAETNDATFNVHETQKPVIVGIAQLTNNIDDYEHGGLELLKDQNEYVATKLKLRFTLDEHDRDIATDLEIDNEIKEISEKISLVNNGLKTMTDKGITMSIVNDKKVIDDLNLSDEGGIATTKTLMVAHECSVDQLENELNPGSLVHIVNREYDENRYRKQLVFTTIEQNPAPAAGVFTAYHVQFLLKGAGEAIPETTYVNPYINLGSGSSASSGAPVMYHGIESPVFRQAAVPEQDRVAVDMFGLENNILGNDNFDILLFSKGNVTLDPYGINDDGASENLLLKSNYNYFNFTGANTDNVLINADYNMVINGALSNLLFGADANYLDGVQGNTIFASNFNIIKGDSYYNIILGGSHHSIKNSDNVLMLGHEGLIANGVSEQVIFGKYNKNTNAKFVYGIGTSDSNRKNALEFYPELGELKVFKDGVEKATLGGDAGLTITSLELDTLKANAITANNKLIVHEPGTGGGISLYYNSAQSAASLYMQGPGISGPYMSYNSENGKFAVAYNAQNYSHGTYIQNEYIECKEKSLYGDDIILINKDINDGFDTYNNNGVLTVYSATSDAHAGSNHDKVNIYSDSIKFSKFDANTNTWKTVREITNTPEYSYKKARADIYVWGKGTLSQNKRWCLGVKYAAGTDKFKTWIKNIFEKTPPFVYTYDNSSSSSNPEAGNLEYVKKVPVDATYPEGYQPVLLGTSDSDLGDLQSIVSGNGNLSTYIGGNDFVIKGTAADSPLQYYSKIPDYFDFEEIEINLFVHAWHRFGFIWLPYVTTNNRVIPQIKLNVHRDDDTSSDLVMWTNRNYNLDGDIEFRNYDIADYCKTLYATNLPFNKDIYDDLSARATLSNPTGWWLEVN